MQNNLIHTAPVENAGESGNRPANASQSPPKTQFAPSAPPRRPPPITPRAPPPLRKKIPCALDAPDDSTKIHASHGSAPRQVPPAPVADRPDSTPERDSALEESLKSVIATLRPAYPGLATLIGQGGLKFVVGRGDGKPYLIRQVADRSYLIEISMDSAEMRALFRSCAAPHGHTPTRRMEEDFIELIAIHAAVHGESINTFYRYAPLKDALGLVIDLGDESGSQVKITAEGVAIIPSHPGTHFRRTKSMLPLTKPAEHGDIRLLDRYLPKDPIQNMLLFAFVTYAIAHSKQDTTKYVHLVLQGNEGSGKTLLSKLLSRLIDPSTIGLRSFAKNIQDLAVAAQSAHLLTFDNIRSVSQAMSDALCICSTGGSITARKLYTDDGQVGLSLHCTVVMNGIEATIDQPDLAQRCLTIRLAPMPDSERLSDDVLNARFEANLPYIMRGLYELIAKIFKHLPTVEVTVPTRMLAFSRWMAALEQVDGVPQGQYQLAYRNLVSAAQLDAVMENPLGEALVALMALEPSGVWCGTPSELLADLEMRTDHRIRRSRDWPNTPIALSKRLQGLQTALSAQGITVQTARGKTRLITLKVTGDKA